jgi:hypothetical protein
MLERVIHKITERPQSLSRNCLNYEERNVAWPVPFTRPFGTIPVSSERLPPSLLRSSGKYVAGLIRCRDDVPIVEGFSSAAATTMSCGFQRYCGVHGPSDGCPRAMRPRVWRLATAWPPDARSGRYEQLPYGRASRIMLNGVSVARRIRVNSPLARTSLRRRSPACAPRARPTSWLSEAGVHTIVEKP